MTSKLPLHKNLYSPESPKTPKPKQTKRLVNRLGNEQKGKILKGLVTALRSDGTVNLTINGNRFNGVETLASYDIRSIGDRVSVIKSGATYTVLGKLGSDDLNDVPTILPASFVQWSWGINSGLSDRQLFIDNGGDGWRVGRLSEQFPTSDYDYFARLGIGYSTGSEPNTMNGPADLTKQIDLFFERSEWDDGYEGAASFTLFGITNTGNLPASPLAGSLLYQVTLNPSSIDFTLEPGEMKIITLPDTWRNNIGAATLDANTIRGFVVEPAGKSVSPADVNAHTYGLLNGVTGGLHIWTP